MKIESLSPENVEHAIKILDQTFLEQGDENARLSLQASLDPDLHREYLEKTRMSRNRYWVIVDEKEETVGVSGLHYYEPDINEAIWGGWTAVLRTRENTGFILMLHVLKQAITSGKKYLRLYAFSSSTEMIERYKKVGFCITRTEGDKVYLQKDLDKYRST